MATLTATVSSDSINLSNGSPYAFITLRGGSGPDVRRVTTRGPMQHGDTDRGYRLGPRDMELVVGFRATTDAILDGYRKTLTSFFKPLKGTPVKLLYTRDDAAPRQVDCHVVGDIKIDLVPEYRPGHYHRATIRLYAPDPAWYNPTQGSVTVLGTSLVASQWYYGGGAVGSAQVVEQGTAPTQGQVWTYTGTPSMAALGDGYTIAFRSGRETITDGKLAFHAGAGGGSPSFTFRTLETTDYVAGAYYVGGYWPLGTAAMLAGTNNYFLSAKVETGNLHTIILYRNSEGLVYYIDDAGFNFALAGTARRWRSDATNSAPSRWSEALHKYAVYVPALTPDQMSAVSTLMDLSPSETNAQVLPIAYQGNLPEYPTIAITGPVTNPSITNLATGETLDFGTITIGAGTTYMIDTRYGQKSVLVGTVSHYGEMTKESDLAEFHIAPNPEALGGTNIFYLDGTAMSAATRFSVAYYNRYTSY